MELSEAFPIYCNISTMIQKCTEQVKFLDVTYTTTDLAYPVLKRREKSPETREHCRIQVNKLDDHYSHGNFFKQEVYLELF